MGIIRRVLWLLFIAAVGYGIYYVSVRWWEGPLTWENAKRQATELFESAKERTTEAVVDTARESAEQYAGEVIKEAKEDAVRYTKEKVTEGFSSIGEKIIGAVERVVQGGILSHDTTEPPSGAAFKAVPTALSVTVGEELVFSFSPGVEYEASWGDGVVARGKVKNDVVRLVRHAWNKAGDYTVTLKTTSSTRSGSEVEIPVRVYQP
jgi:hypothetical protein